MQCIIRVQYMITVQYLYKSHITTRTWTLTAMLWFTYFITMDE